MSRDSLQMGEQSWLWHYRENNPGVLSDTFYQRSHSSIWAEEEEFWGRVMDEEQLNPTQL